MRVNAIGSSWCHLDLAALAAAGSGPLTAVLPKVESAGDLAFADRLLDGAEAAAARATPVRLQALIETAAGLAAAAEIARASERLDALILGYADLAASLGRTGGAGAARTGGMRRRPCSSPRARPASRRSTGRTWASATTTSSARP